MNWDLFFVLLAVGSVSFWSGWFARRAGEPPKRPIAVLNVDELGLDRLSTALYRGRDAWPGGISMPVYDPANPGGDAVRHQRFVVDLPLPRDEFEPVDDGLVRGDTADVDLTDEDIRDAEVVDNETHPDPPSRSELAGAIDLTDVIDLPDLPAGTSVKFIPSDEHDADPFLSWLRGEPRADEQGPA